ncbi:Brp/Blh family beta-carotene 15,15'-dioxygenase [Sphingomonas sp. 22R3R2A-7]|uniref:Brp/Blh family beta-carotene 15,15'-dioxygenase n=1 Tax=Sphingomonas sp. 22R3R2A-7 TaxID=3050230 RepID=UPI002FDF40BA
MPCDAVTIVAHPRPSSERRASSDRRASSRHRAPSGRGDVVYPAYWVAAAALIVATLLGLPLGQPAAVVAATIVFIGGGLPHGAYDIALLRRAVALDRSRVGLARGGLTGDGLLRVGLVVGGYVATALLMVSLWLTVPLVALVLFLAVAAVHFGEDWAMLEEPLLRVAAGAAVIGAATIGHPSAVSAVFVAMSDPRAAVVARIVTAIAPVALLVTLVGIALAWRQGSRHWASAMAVCLGLLIVLPPVAGFALFFVFLHSPRHLAQTRVLLRDMTRARWIGTGALLSGVAILGWWGVRVIAPSRFDPSFGAQAFQLLASVAVPHLLLSRWLERRLAVACCAEDQTAAP